MHDPTPRVLARRRQIGARIRDARTWANLTQEQLAERAEISRDTIHRIEYGIRSARLDHLLVIADALHMPLAVLVREDDEAPDADDVGGS